MLPLVIRSGTGILGSDDIKTRKVDQLKIDKEDDKDKDNGNVNDNDDQVEGLDLWWAGSLPASRCF